MREKLALTEQQLQVCLQEQYGVIPVTFDFLPLGLDTRAGIYRVVSEQGTSYYRYERVAQDLIECAEQVFIRDDPEEESKAAAAQLFREVLAQGGEIAAASAAAAHLPQDLTIDIRGLF